MGTSDTLRVLFVDGFVARTALEVIVVRLNIFSQINDFAACRLITFALPKRNAFLIGCQFVSLKFSFREDRFIRASSGTHAPCSRCRYRDQ